MEKKTLSVKEAAEVLGVSRNLVYEAARRGEIRVVRIGRRLVVPADALAALLDPQLVDGEAK